MSENASSVDGMRLCRVIMGCRVCQEETAPKRISRNEDETGASNAFSFSPARIVDPLKIAPAPSAVPDAIRPEKQPTLRTFWARINSYLRPSNPRKTPTRRHYSLRWDSPSFWFGLARLLESLSLSVSLVLRLQTTTGPLASRPADLVSHTLHVSSTQSCAGSFAPPLSSHPAFPSSILLASYCVSPSSTSSTFTHPFLLRQDVLEPPS